MKAYRAIACTMAQVDSAFAATAKQSATDTRTEIDTAVVANQPSISSTTSLRLNSVSAAGTITASQDLPRPTKLT